MSPLLPCCETLVLKQAWLSRCDKRMTLAGTTGSLMHARERERKREREERKRKSKGEGSRPGEREKERREQAKGASAMPDLPRPGVEVLAANRQKRKKENPGRPRERKGEEEGGREEKGRNKPRNRGPRVPKTAKKRNSLNQIRKTIQKRAPRTSGNTSNTNNGVRCPKLSAKTRRNKNRTPKKTSLRKGELFYAVFGTQKGHF